MKRLVKLVDRKMHYPLKRMVKRVFNNYVYVARHDLIKGFKVTGDLGFLRKPSLAYEDRFLMSLNLAGKTVYDVGGHIGLMTLFFSRAVGEVGKVISFEPNPETFAILCKNVNMNSLPNVKPVNLGLAEKRDTLLLVYGEYDGGLGTMDKAGQTKLFDNKLGLKIQTASVKVCPLDEYISTESLPDPDFVKIDVEGYEYNVLSGMQDTIRRCKPLLLVEIHGVDKEGLLGNLRRIVALLTSHGYEIQEITAGERICESNIEVVLKGMMLFCK